jgi:FkbM family methyltransferase
MITYMNLRSVEKYVLGMPIRISADISDKYFDWLTDTPGVPEKDIVKLVSATATDDSWYIDAGANIGYISIIMSVVSPKGKIFSFEPAMKTFAVFMTNIKQNNIKNITASNYGLSHKKSTALLSQSADNTAGAFVNTEITKDIKGHINEQIELKTLDQEYTKLGITKCNLIKVDIEGHEASFLKGAEAFIKKFKPYAIIEANHWCLNIFSRQSLPDFIDETYSYFDVIFAFSEGHYLDLSNKEARYKFFYENTVNNNYTNLYCGFDKKETLANIERAFAETDISQVAGLEKELATAKQALVDLQAVNEDIKNARSYKIAKRLNKIVRR